LLWRLTVETTRLCLRYRVTGLAAEAGFFALLSLPPLVLGLVGAIGFVGQQMGTEVVADLRSQLRQLTLTFLTADSVSSVILPTFDRVVGAGRADIVSIGFLLSLWSGSRVLNVYVDTVSMMYGMGGYRGIIRTRALSFSLYVAGLIVGVVVIPLVLIGPGILARMLNSADLDVVATVSQILYWPTVSLAALAALCTLYHVATPIRSPWRRDLPGAALALVIWVLASFVLRWVIGHSVGGSSIYGPLATPIVVLIWLYFLAIAVLIGAALNAAIDERYPTPARVEAKKTRGAVTSGQLTPNRSELKGGPDVGWPGDELPTPPTPTPPTPTPPTPTPPTPTPPTPSPPPPSPPPPSPPTPSPPPPSPPTPSPPPPSPPTPTPPTPSPPPPFPPTPTPPTAPVVRAEPEPGSALPPQPVE
jgi:membrane protein